MISVLALIPARGGSKGVPNKNIARVGGKPLVAWTILAAKQVRSVDRIVVTTDSPEIARVARDYQAEVPFIRPPELALDDTPGMPPILHAIQWLETNQSYCPDYIMCLQPTSPLRSSQDIDAVIRIALDKDADSIVSVSSVQQHPQWMKYVDAEGRMADYFPAADLIMRRQDLPPVYALNGAIYLTRRNILLEKETWYAPETYAYIMPPERSIDIDTSWDLYLTNLLLLNQE
ncbi:MAG: acylneuraminate cytidylyltransferase family protein [Anaerolineae bacterium]|nr:acylneuraminate cytidylyltransferase family protein [Anaerolineae bacterium]MBL6966212.1 acylneuraminate cytidylyltransferase family protein [Anaerolineales bacterium]